MIRSSHSETAPQPLLSRYTTLGVGGPAARIESPLSVSEVIDVLRSARQAEAPVVVLGGGSNTLVADAGVPGWVMRPMDFRFACRDEGGAVVLTAGAGVVWDELVAFCVSEGLAGVEALSGIPGHVGAAPIQNVGAYGAEVADVIDAVEVVDRQRLGVATLPASACAFGYRTSAFKQGAYQDAVVTAVSFRLRRAQRGAVRYPELARALGIPAGAQEAPIARIRECVLALRRSKSMLLEPSDPNHRSAGSFFLNPVVSEDARGAALARGRTCGVDTSAMPGWPHDGAVKLSAAWLVEQAGFPRGFAFGRAGISTRHALAIVNSGDARASDIVTLARLVRRRVHETFGVTLTPEPVFVGFDRPVDELLS